MSTMKVRIKPRPLLKVLARRNMSQNGLGRVAGLTSGHVSQLVRGQRNVSPETRGRILKALEGISFDDIFSIQFLGKS